MKDLSLDSNVFRSSNVSVDPLQIYVQTHFQLLCFLAGSFIAKVYICKFKDQNNGHYSYITSLLSFTFLIFWLVNFIRINITNIITKYLVKHQTMHVFVVH